MAELARVPGDGGVARHVLRQRHERVVPDGQHLVAAGLLEQVRVRPGKRLAALVLIEGVAGTDLEQLVERQLVAIGRPDEAGLLRGDGDQQVDAEGCRSHGRLEFGAEGFLEPAQRVDVDHAPGDYLTTA